MTYDTKNPYPREGEGAYIEYTSSSMLLASMFEVIGVVNIPRNYQNGAFNDSEISQKAKFMDISLINLTGENNGDSIVLNPGDSFTLDCIIYLTLYNNLKVFRIDSSNNDFSISIYDMTDTKIKDIQNNEDLKNYNINNTEFKVKITANSSTIINNIHFGIVTKTPDNDSKVKIFLDQIEGVDQWENELIEKVLETEELEDINEIPRTAKIGDVFFNKEGTELSLSAQELLNVIKTVDGIDSGLDAEYLGGEKHDLFASKVQTVTKKYSELVNGDYIVGCNHIGSISGKYIVINLENGNWIGLSTYGEFTQLENGGVFNGSYVSSDMSTSEIDSCLTFEVQETQDLIDVKNELLTKIGDNITIEKYGNGIRIKKNEDYVFSACWGSVNITTTGSNGLTTTTVNFPFTFHNIGGVLTNVIGGSPLLQNSSNGGLTTSSVDVTVQRTTAGTSGVRWYAYGS